MFKSFIFSAFALFSTQFLVAQIPTVSSADLRNAALESTPGPKLSAVRHDTTQVITTAEELLKHVGEVVIVEATVMGTYVYPDGRSKIDLFAKYPKNQIDVLIPAVDKPKFSAVESFKGKKVRVKGKLRPGSERYPKPAIFLNNPDQIQIIE
jgi:hypothetical protein